MHSYYNCHNSIEGDINMEPTIYFDKESPDFNYGLWGRPERLAANRVVICMMTEYGLCNDRRMQAQQVNRIIESLQMTTGTFKEPREKIKPEDAYVKKGRPSNSATCPIRTIGPTALNEHTSEDSPIESTS